MIENNVDKSLDEVNGAEGNEVEKKSNPKHMKGIFITSIVLTSIATVALLFAAYFLSGVYALKTAIGGAEGWEGLGIGIGFAVYLIFYFIADVVMLVLSGVSLCFSIPAAKKGEGKVSGGAKVITWIDVGYIAVAVLSFVISIIILSST